MERVGSFMALAGVVIVGGAALIAMSRNQVASPAPATDAGDTPLVR